MDQSNSCIQLLSRKCKSCNYYVQLFMLAFREKWFGQVLASVRMQGLTYPCVISILLRGLKCMHIHTSIHSHDHLATYCSLHSLLGSSTSGCRTGGSLYLLTPSPSTLLHHPPHHHHHHCSLPTTNAIGGCPACPPSLVLSAS